MPKETPELPISQQEVQIQAPSLFEKIADRVKNQKLGILLGILTVFVLAGLVFAGYKLLMIYQAGQPRCLIPEGCPPKKEFLQPTLTPTPLPFEVPPAGEAGPTKEGDPTANWKTYTNTKYGYLIKLPSDWGEWSIETGKWGFSPTINQASELVLLGNNVPVTTTNEGIIIPPQKIDLSVELNKTKSWWISTYKIPDPEKNCREEPQTIGGSILASKILCRGVESIAYIIEKDNNLYRITTGKQFPEFNLMLSTFRFLPSVGSGQGE